MLYHLGKSGQDCCSLNKIQDQSQSTNKIAIKSHWHDMDSKSLILRLTMSSIWTMEVWLQQGRKLAQGM